MNFTLKKSDLNFKVYTVPSKPTTPGAENDIAIISSVPMTNWLMSPEAPSGIPRNDGDVWIQYSTSGNTFNALKQNTMMIATIKAWQYVGGAWVDREAVSCQGGVWVNLWNGELYDAGNEYEFVTGGWSASSTANGTVTEGTDSVTVAYTDTTNTNNSVAWCTEKAVDLSGYSKVMFNVTNYTGSANYMGCALATGRPYGGGTTYASFILSTIRFSGAGVFEIVIPSGVTSAYVVISDCWGRVSSATISKIWLEK